jgi:NAD(P)-dependent dehydrogenase (short-subunit alcohol dehydrogenase family)
MDLKNASALVTGAGRGIGRAIAVTLARQGARVTAVARTHGELESLSGEAGVPILIHPGDIRERAVCDEAVARSVRAHGGLQILVNNAGVGGQAPLAETSDELWARILATNLTAVFQLSRAALPHLADKGGHVFMISSLAGQNPIAGLGAYCASKAALDHFARCLMLEVRHFGVKVTTLAPGSVNTTFGALHKGDSDWMLKPQDVADVVLDLLQAREGAHSSRVEMRPLRPPKGA